MKPLLSKYSNLLQKECCFSWSFLILRAVAGLALMFHGWGKVQNPLNWMGSDTAIPGILQALAAIAEFGGGLAWILGLLAPLASLGILCTMIVAASTHIMRGDAFAGTSPSYELASLFACIALVVLINGPGKYSLDYLLFGKKN